MEKASFKGLKYLTKTQYLIKVQCNFKEKVVLIKLNNAGKATSCWWYYEGFKMSMSSNRKLEKFIIDQFNDYRKTLLA